MTTDHFENSFNAIMDGMKEGDDVVRRKAIRIRILEAALKNIKVNRYAIQIVRALIRGDKSKVAELIMEARKCGIDIDDLKGACRAQRGK